MHKILTTILCSLIMGGCYSSKIGKNPVADGQNMMYECLSALKHGNADKANDIIGRYINVYASADTSEVAAFYNASSETYWNLNAKSQSPEWKTFIDKMRPIMEWYITSGEAISSLPNYSKLKELKSAYQKFKPFQYDNGDDYVRDGLYRIVDERGRIGYADKNWNTVITPRFAFGFPFENGKAKVTDTGQLKEVEGSRGEYHYWESDDWYYIDKSGRKIDR
ncbi:hypothetical protein [Muribaculum sp.]|uniref:hypothetical protein n=1 Tax=Muribaculum sp. TaxID=1918611 RepID=UPI0026039A7D|nr:hypothetical protein [Muribaculum sp.]